MERGKSKLISTSFNFSQISTMRYSLLADTTFSKKLGGGSGEWGTNQNSGT